MYKSQGASPIGAWSLGLRWSLGLGALLIAAGCINGKGNTANIALRKEIQQLQATLADRDSQRSADQKQIAALTADRTIQTLPAERLNLLFKTSSIKFKALVSGEDFDRATPGDEGFLISFTPVDQFGDEFKAAGRVRIELFDLSASNPRIGEWTLTTAEAQPRWLSTPVFDGYVIKERWQTVPQHGQLSVKVTFVEELTGSSFDATTQLKAELPPSTQPTR